MTDTARRMMVAPITGDVHEYDERCCDRPGLEPCAPITPSNQEASHTADVDAMLNGRADWAPTTRLYVHSPKPYRWQLREVRDPVDDEPPVADYLHADTARRLAACWNYFTDGPIETATIEAAITQDRGAWPLTLEENTSLKAQLNAALEASSIAESGRLNAEAECERLREALERYGGHVVGCDWGTAICSCGFSALTSRSSGAERAGEGVDLNA